MAGVKCPKIHFLNGSDFCPFVGLGTIQNPEEVGPALRHAIDLGYRHIDCAALYKNEKEIGEILKEKTTVGTGSIPREEFFITSKVWGTHLSPEKARESCEKSLADLNLEELDLLLIHVPFGLKEGDESFPKEEDGTFCLSDVDYVDTWKTFESLVDERLVRYIGVSNFNCEQLQRLLDTPGLRYRPVCNQIEISPYYVNEKLLKFCQTKDTPVIAYAPLGAPARPWTNTVRLRCDRSIILCFIDMLSLALNFGINQVISITIKENDGVFWKDETLKLIGKTHGKKPAQVALRWGIQRGYAVIPKSSNPEHLKENLDVFNFSLTANQMEKITKLNKNQKSYGLEGAKKSRNYPFNETTEIPEAGSAIL